MRFEGRAGREAVAFDVRHLDALGELALVRDEGVGGDDEVRDHPLNAPLFLLRLDLRKRAPLRAPQSQPHMRRPSVLVEEHRRPVERVHARGPVSPLPTQHGDAGPRCRLRDLVHHSLVFWLLL